jgi:hypothetical protein
MATHLPIQSDPQEIIASLCERVEALERRLHEAGALDAVTKKEAARRLSVSPWTVWKLIATGQIKVTPYGRVPVSEIGRHLTEAAKLTPRRSNNL